MNFVVLYDFECFSFYQLRSKLSAIASSANQSSTDDLIKVLREKHAKKQGMVYLYCSTEITKANITNSQ